MEEWWCKWSGRVNRMQKRLDMSIASVHCNNCDVKHTWLLVATLSISVMYNISSSLDIRMSLVKRWGDWSSHSLVRFVNGVYSVKVHIVFSSSAPTVHLHLTAPSKELHLLLLYPRHSFSDAQALKLLLCWVDTDTQFFIYKVYTCKPKSQLFYWLLGAYACKTNYLWILNNQLFYWLLVQSSSAWRYHCALICYLSTWFIFSTSAILTYLLSCTAPVLLVHAWFTFNQ